jgi:hypothetical protein
MESLAFYIDLALQLVRQMERVRPCSRGTNGEVGLALSV